ncbi:integrase [Iodidimonas gelatinilytica]|uniref:Integrase n=2 Tax=Iodidimonas gelatinilytica TaxID=1236966 RepID=A0A5A7ML18_9PROT|nr:site-specific integrase [Iodidimonas gelatinilytica]GEQ96640.1 integrase [Iodidimonas gelatinilytica]
MTIKLTKRIIDAATAQDKDYMLWDAEVKGFGLRVYASGIKSYIIQYRNAAKRTRKLTLGQHGVLTPDEARKLARDKLMSVTHGEDPSAERQDFVRSPTVADLCDRFISTHVERHCKPVTIREYRRCIEIFIKPTIGHMKAVEVERRHISALHAKHGSTPYQANRTLSVLSILFNKTEEWGLRPDGSNPCRHVKKYPEEKKERYLTRDEIAALLATLDERQAAGLENMFFVAGIKLLLFTGARLGEIQTAKWDYVRGNVMELPDSKTGKKRIYLGTAALEVLARLPKLEGNPHIIAGAKDGGYLTDFQKPWRRVRAAAGLNDVRIHDLRHTFASYAASSGESLHMTGKLLGHSQAQTTMRYAHLADAPMLEAAERVSQAINASKKCESK